MQSLFYLSNDCVAMRLLAPHARVLFRLVFLKLVFALEAVRVSWTVLVWTDVIASLSVNASYMAIEVGLLAKWFAVLAAINETVFRIKMVVALMPFQLLLGLECRFGSI